MAPRKSKTYLKPSEVAELLRVEPGTIRVWAQSGRLRATTTPGGHRRFAHRDVEAFARQHGLALATPEHGVLRVLIVDDDPQMRSLLQRMLASTATPVETETAHDGFSAGQRLAKFEPHAVVLDLFMPGVNGFELCKTLKADPATADIRVIAITGAADSETMARILELGAERCLAKPIARDQLLAAVGLEPAKAAEAG
jgi:excisionase family DNA binding protein